jgi:hypothetical protein
MALESDSPHLAITLGHYIKHISLLKGSLGIQEENEEFVKEARYFSEFYQAHWNNRASSVAKRRQKLRHINKPSKIPLSSDLIKMKQWMESELNEAIKVELPSRTHWESTAKKKL